MEKIKRIIKKHDNIFIVIIILLFTIANLIKYELRPYDTLWVFGNIYKLSIGKIIYKDVNIIEPPLFFEFGKIILNIFNQNYFAFIIYGAITITLYYFSFYLIFKKLKMRKLVSILGTIVILWITKDVIAGQANYNLLAMLFYQFGLLEMIKSVDKTEKKTSWIVQPVIIMSIILTNQKIAVGYIIAYVITEIIINKKKSINNILKTGLTVICFTIIFLVYEYLKGNLLNFINLCILGLIEFKQNFVIEMKCILYAIIIIIISIIVFAFLIKNNIQQKKLSILLIYAISSMIIMFPIVNQYHFLLSFVIWVILIVYEIHLMLKDIVDDRLEKILEILIATFLIIILILVGIRICKYKNNINNRPKNLFWGAIISEKLQNNIDNVEKYIKEKQNSGKNVRLWSIYSMLYTLNLNIDNGYWDMPLKGNLGLNGEETIINEIKGISKNTIILVENHEKSEYNVYQFVERISDFIKENYNYVESIENFDVYEIK